MTGPSLRDEVEPMREEELEIVPLECRLGIDPAGEDPVDEGSRGAEDIELAGSGRVFEIVTEGNVAGEASCGAEI